MKTAGEDADVHQELGVCAETDQDGQDAQGVSGEVCLELLVVEPLEVEPLLEQDFQHRRDFHGVGEEFLSHQELGACAATDHQDQILDHRLLAGLDRALVRLAFCEDESDL